MVAAAGRADFLGSVGSENPSNNFSLLRSRIDQRRGLWFTEKSVAQGSCIVIVAAPDLLESVKERAAESGELIAFPDVEAVKALETIVRRKARIVILERMFAATPRGVALMNRIKADPKLTKTEVKVIAHDSDYSRLPARHVPVESSGGGAATATATQTHVAAYSASRRAPRFRMTADLPGVLVDGNSAQLIDLSTIGAQVVSVTTLKPNQRVRVALPDDQMNIRMNAVVAWASYEIPPQSTPRYRAGIEFADADVRMIDSFIRKHKS